jgi:hydroxymethylglutaryl-CoA lyase
MAFPRQVLITDVGPRDGLQMEARQVPTDEKVALIAGLVRSGLRAIQVASFVHPLKVPQMADAEAVIERLPTADGIQYSALALNHQGVQRALKTAIPWIEISVSASDAHGRVNAGLPLERVSVEVDRMMSAALQAGRKVRASIQCSFGCVDGEPVPDEQILQLADLFLGYDIDQLLLADTTGRGTPLEVKRLLRTLLPMAADTPVGLHLHDTRGLGLVNAMAGLEMGISHFDTSLGGLGGCPFVPGAAGNIATEDTVYLLNTLAIATGIDIYGIACCSRRLSRLLQHPLPGKLYRIESDSEKGPGCPAPVD